MFKASNYADYKDKLFAQIPFSTKKPNFWRATYLLQQSITPQTGYKIKESQLCSLQDCERTTGGTEIENYPF